MRILAAFGVAAIVGLAVPMLRSGSRHEGVGTWSLLLGAAPVALAQQTCPAGQEYCPSGAYSGQCRPNTVTCPTGSVSATVGGCSTCSCPGGQVVCSGACQVARQCPDANRTTANQCAMSDAASCGACSTGYDLNSATGLCEESKPVLIAPVSVQERESDRSTINVIQKGSGNILRLGVQQGADTTTRRTVLSADRTGIQIGYDPDPGRIGSDLSAAGGQNLFYGIAKVAGMDPVLDALLLLQTKADDGTITDRIKVTRDGNLTASGKVRGTELCIGGDCKSAWPAVAPVGVLLQDVAPGTQQTGHFSVSGIGRVGTLIASGAGTIGSLIIGSGGSVNLQGAMVSNASWISGSAIGTTPPALRLTGDGDIVLIPKNTGVGRGLIVWHGAVDPAVVGYAKISHDGTGAYFGSNASQGIKVSATSVDVPTTLDVAGGIQAGSGNVNIINSAGKIPAISSTYVADLSGENLTNLVKLQAVTPGTAQTGHLNITGTGTVGALDVVGGMQAGSGNVNIINSAGKIPAISSTYVADLSGANLTNLNAGNLASGTVPDARLPAGLLRNPIEGSASDGVTPWLTLQGGASAIANVALRLYDLGTANAGVNVLEFAYSNGSSPAGVAWIKAVSSGTNAANGAILKLETASNNIGTRNLDQLVLDRTGNVGIGAISPNTKLSVYSGDESTTLTNFTQALTKAGMNIVTDYTAGAYTPGLFWSTQNNNATKPKAGIWLLEDGSGTDMLFGTSDSYATGITNTALTIDQSGDLAASGALTANNTYECVNVGTELRCNLRQYWRVADKTSGYVESWVGSDTCTNVCSRAGLRTCTDIQFNYECPNGTLMQSWQDDDPGEFSPSERTCSSSEPYRAVVSGITCAGQSGTEYKRYRCRCES
ncbi:hypothetical protein HY635_03400 [Candidatus Uhrbacteria bacterium]|nr:hypothetical protein [Candidatus Uhrbacteria bacterium]